MHTYCKFILFKTYQFVHPPCLMAPVLLISLVCYRFFVLFCFSLFFIFYFVGLPSVLWLILFAPLNCSLVIECGPVSLTFITFIYRSFEKKKYVRLMLLRSDLITNNNISNWILKQLFSYLGYRRKKTHFDCIHILTTREGENHLHPVLLASYLFY